MSAVLAKIHIAKKDLRLTDDEYRAVIAFHFGGKTSAKELSPRQQAVLLNHFKAKGWQSKKPKKAGKAPFKNTRPPAGRGPLLAKIEAHLAERDLPWSYANGMAKKICKVDAIEFCDEEMLWKIVAAFEYDSKRKGSRLHRGLDNGR